MQLVLDHPWYRAAIQSASDLELTSIVLNLSLKASDPGITRGLGHKQW